ncbi:MAG: hypothetical protein JST70_07910 [Bacteroidetes bacterium]|nr:hypothetical protein [Bacteroidota bacterium]
MSSSIKKQTEGTQSPVLRFFANVASFVFHPVFMPTVLLCLLYILAPSSFVGFSIQNFNTALAIIAINTLFFPLITVLLLKGLGFIQSIYMHDAKDRIIPLIATMIFYFWAYLVFKNRIFKEVDTPFILRVMLLGNFWGVILLFMVNIFYKASMHTSAAGGFLGVMIVLLMINPVNMVLPLFVSLLICGIIGTARLLTGAHKPAEIWVGYGLGIIVQVAAYLYLL